MTSARPIVCDAETCVVRVPYHHEPRHFPFTAYRMTCGCCTGCVCVRWDSIKALVCDAHILVLGS